MSFSEPDLVVGRNFAHVWELTKKYPQAEIVTVSTFFNRVGQLIFLENKNIWLDEGAPLVIAQNLLATTHDFPLSMAKNFAQLHSLLLQGCCTIDKVQDRFLKASEALRKVVKIAALLEDEMAQKSLVTTARALFLTYELLRHKKVRPPAFLKTSRISLHYAVDLSPLQINVIKELSALGMAFELVMPAGFRHKSINASIDFIVRQFELSNEVSKIEIRFENMAKGGPLKELVENLFVDDNSIAISNESSFVNVANQIENEAQFIAQKIAKIKTARPFDSVALAVRTHDARLEVYKRALVHHNLQVSDRQGIPLLNSECGILLFTLFSARLSVLSRRDLVGLIQHKMFTFSVDSLQEKARIQLLLNKIGVDDSIAHDTFICRYLGKLEKYRQFLNGDAVEIDIVNLVIDLIKNINDILFLLKKKDTFYGFLCSVEKILDVAVKKSKLDPSFFKIHKSVVSLKNSRAYSEADQAEVTIHDFIILLKSRLSSQTILSTENDQTNAVEILLLPEMLGRSFDHVFIADIAFGRLPKNSAQDSLMTDELRLELNQSLNAFVLPICFDDPFAPMPEPSSQAMEPFWFASTLACANKSIAFSYARHDLGGQEQAASEFFGWLRKNVWQNPPKAISTDLTIPHADDKFCSSDYLRFLQGKKDRWSKDCQSLQQKALHQREGAFKDQRADEFAFLFNENDVQDSFAGRIGQEAYRALTPTFIERFSACAFKGFYQRILQIDDASDEIDGIDMRAIGKIAHKTLEIFFAEPILSITKTELDKRLEQILNRVTQNYCSKNYIKNDVIFFCQGEWLKDALSNLVMDIFTQNPLALSRAPKQEVAFGLGKTQFPPLPVMYKGRKYFVGGIADRIDETGAQYLVMDYKLSSLTNLKLSTGPRALLKTHFQMPIYLKLVSKYLARDDYDKVSFIFASIRDGRLLKPVNFYNNKKLFDLIFNDEDPESLAANIDSIFFPIAHGQILAKANETCSHCKLSKVCRKDEVN